MTATEPQREFAMQVVHRLQDAGYTALWAGGCVRDLLLHRNAEDYDVATNARPEEVRQLFGRRKTLAVGASFGVIVVLGKKEQGQVEVATFRKEGCYLDGRHPEDVVFSTPEEDAQRRDFTINGMFYDPIHQRVLDFVDGQADLENRVVRAIGSPYERMQEDKLRMLRAVRFAANLNFQLDSQTATAIRNMAAEIKAVSAERISQELRRMLAHRNRRRAVALCQSVGLLRQIIPEISFDSRRDKATHDLPVDSADADRETTLQMLDMLENESFELAAAILLRRVNERSATSSGHHDNRRKTRHSDSVIHRICRRLRLSRREMEHIAWLVANQNALRNPDDLELAVLKRLLAHPLHDSLIQLTEVVERAIDGTARSAEFCRQYLRETPLEEIDPPVLVTGCDLINRGLRKGPRFRRLLDAVRTAQLNGEIATFEEAMSLIDRLIDSAQESAST